MVKIGIVSSEFEDSNERYGINFKKAKECGYERLDYQGLIHTDNAPYKMNEDEFIKYFEGMKLEAMSYGIAFSQLHSAWEWEIEVTEDGRKKYMESHKKCILAAKLLGVKGIAIHFFAPTGWNPDHFDEDMEYTKNALNELLDLCDRYDVDLCLENLPFGYNEQYSAHKTADYIRSFNRKHLKMTLDTGHMNVFNEDPRETLNYIKDVLVLTHVHDNNGHQDLHLEPYMGNLNWDSFIKGMIDIKFNGTLSLEMCTPKKLNPISYNLYQKALMSNIDDMRNKINEGIVE